MRRLAVATVLAALLSAAGSGVLLARGSSGWAVVALAAFLAALAAAVRTSIRLWRWPPGRLGLFRDRLILVQPRTELHVRWEDLNTATLADLGDWAADRWPEVALTERLTLRLERGRRISFRPASFGLDPQACRDLLLRLRDEPSVRERLPEFSSALDLGRRPFMGEGIRPDL